MIKLSKEEKERIDMQEHNYCHLLYGIENSWDLFDRAVENRVIVMYRNLNPVIEEAEQMYKDGLINEEQYKDIQHEIAFARRAINRMFNK